MREVYCDTLNLLSELLTDVPPLAAKTPLLVSTNGGASGRSEVRVAGRPYHRGAPMSPDAILDAYRVGGRAVLAEFDGAFGIVVTDAQRGEVHAVTDRFNVVPLYWGERDDGIAIGSHSDVLASYLGKQKDFDLVTLAQALHMWYATFPYTYYEGIRELGPGTVHTWDKDGRYLARPYWEPEFRGDQDLPTDELAERLSEAIREGVQRRVEQAENPALLLSAGADSRGLLFSAADVGSISCYTFYDQPNAELKISARLATSADQKHIGLQRDPEYYGRIARKATRLMGGMWNFLDGHSVGFLDRFAKDEIDLFLSGDFADLLYKGAGLNVTYQKLWGKNLTIKKVAPWSANWRNPTMPVAYSFRDAISARVRDQYAGVNTAKPDEYDWWNIVHRRVGTLSRTGSIGGPLTLQRALPWDTFMADAAMASVYEQLTTDTRVNSSVWEGAIKKLTPSKARHIPNNNWGARVGASDLEKTARFLYGVAYRKLRKRDIDGTPLNSAITRGSWPNFNYFLRHSAVVDDLWTHRNPQVTEVLNDLTGTNLTDPEVSAAARTAGMGFGRLLTLKLWLEDRFSESVPHAPSAP